MTSIVSTVPSQLKHAAPQTPPLSASFHRDLLDSPFSDYYTDSSRSSAQTTSSDAQRDLLRRLSFLSSLIQRAEPSPQCIRSVHARLDAVEAALSAPESQSRLHLEDSGLFLEDDETSLADEKAALDEFDAAPSEKERENEAQRGHMSFEIADRFVKNMEEHLDYMNTMLDDAKQREQVMQELLDEARDREQTMQGLVDNVESSRKGLRARFEEVKQINKISTAHIDVLKMENTCLQSIRTILTDRLSQCESDIETLDRQVAAGLQASTPTLLQDPRSTQWKHTVTPSATASPVHEDGMEHNSPTHRHGLGAPSRWGAFWEALGDSVGIVDYERLMTDE